MSEEPQRLLEEGMLTEDERRALEIGAQERSPVGAKSAVWAALSLKLAAPATAAAATLTAAATGSTGAAAASGAGAGAGAAGVLTTMALVKSAGIGLALGAAVGSGLYFGGRTEPKPPAPRELVVEGATSVAAPFHAAAATPHAPSTPESASAIPAPSSPPRADGTRSERPREAPPVESESQRVARARAWLRAGNANRALETLGALERDEPNGLLAQEREALVVEALAALGRRDAARARADAFLARYPTSPHVLAVRRAAGSAP